MFRRQDAAFEEIIVGAVGALQFDVLKVRLEGEYGVDVNIQPLSYSAVRWVRQSPLELNKLRLTSSTLIAQDRQGRSVLLFDSPWQIDWALENNPGLQLGDTAPR